MINTIIHLIKEITFKQVSRDQPLVSSNLLDSVAIVELILSLEREFGIELDIEDMTPEKLETVNSIEVLINERLSEPSIKANIQ